MGRTTTASALRICAIWALFVNLDLALDVSSFSFSSHFSQFSNLLAFPQNS